MEKLEMIWHKLDALEKAIGALIAKDAVKETYQLLKKEEMAQRKWNTWALLIIIGMMAFMTWLTRAYTSVISMACLLYTSPSPRDATLSRMPSSA